MAEFETTASERVKTFAPSGLEHLHLGELRAFMDAKGFDLDIVAKLAQDRQFGALFTTLVLRTERLNKEQLDNFGAILSLVEPAKTTAYRGSDFQNSRIDMALANSGITSGSRRHGEGAATFFDSEDLKVPRAIRSVPIALVGYGAAGILAAYALRELGFTKITVYEKAKTLGIWGYENVFRLSRNNPLRLGFFNHELDAAPGDGEEVQEFLAHLVTQKPQETKVTRIEPGKLRHKLTLADGTTVLYPIVINAVGLGKPKPVSDSSRMMTTTGVQHAGYRWQYQLEPRKIDGQRIILIGLGNSTAEMLRQIHTIIDRGYEIDYRVLTHYPKDAIENPSSYVSLKRKMYRVFRDVSRPNLVDYQGDLAHSRYDFFRALHGGKIISRVTRWEVFDPGSITVFRHETTESLAYDKIMTLIGYHQPEEIMRALGCTWSKKQKCSAFDYDGEVAAIALSSDAHRRLHTGYFGFGSVLETPLNPNAVVIPGMLHRMGDLLFGVVMRAAEVRKKELLQG